MIFWMERRKERDGMDVGRAFPQVFEDANAVELHEFSLATSH